MSNNTLVLVHETHRETYQARFCLIYSITAGTYIVIMAET